MIADFIPSQVKFPEGLEPDGYCRSVEVAAVIGVIHSYAKALPVFETLARCMFFQPHASGFDGSSLLIECIST